MNNKVITHKREDIDVKDILKLLVNYKWLIISIMFLFLLISNIYLFVTPSTYSTHAIIEVKNYDKNSRLTDDILQNVFYATNKEIDKEMEILKTFKINEAVIKEVNLETQFFFKDEYKKYEIYGKDLPIKIKNIKILNDDILTKSIKLTAKEKGFSLELENKKILLKNNILLDGKKVFPYGKVIKTDYFEFSVKKIKKFNRPIYFILNGDNRHIYENIITKKLRIQQRNANAPLIWITYEDNIPKRAENYVNKLVDSFLKEGLSSKSTRNDKILKFINDRIKETKKKLDSSEKILQSYKIKNKIISTSLQSTNVINHLGDIEIKISENELKNQLINNVLNVIKRGKPIDSIRPLLNGLGDDSMDNYFISLEKLKLQESELSSNYTNEYPRLINIRKQISSLKQQIYLNIKNLKSSIQYKGENLKKIKKDYEADLLTLPKKEIVLVNLTRKYEVNSKMYAYLLEKKSENDMIKVATISDYKIVEKAYVPLLPIKPKKPLVMFFSLIMGLVLGIIMALIHNGSSGNKIRSVEDIKSSKPFKLNATIPLFKKQKINRIEIFEQPQSNFAESYRKLRTDLKFLFQSKSSNIILVTSLLNKEGKSTTVANLGAIFQLAGYKTIVIDLDLRNPALHKYFDIDYRGGVSEYLAGKVNISDIIFSTAYPNLDIVPIGSIPLNPSELMLSDRLGIMFEKLKERYDYVIIDSTPIKTLTDTLNLMKYSDINLVLLRANKIKKIDINKLEEIIDKYSLDNIGLILNAVKS